MEKEEKDVKVVLDDYVKEYMLTSPYDKYVNLVGISTVGLQKGKYGKSSDSTLEELCLSVGFRENPPKKIRKELPEVYKGVLVFYELIGEIKPL